ncbi:centrosomal protein of 295 kDa-like [Homalodisca vitripennis]|uniref:centrosomal protein of 295 kDa-like n=1 Tax=Homalodisca vitripennis TaxID=197043 RepID=UPI001EE9C6FF|nr:centrosomal protein of 295 kDa-like [Homalodisca vitripennis]
MSHSTGNVTNKSAINFELEKKKELERRKILRLLQVRQQSKDFASKLRENIKEETINQKNKICEMKRKQIQEKRLEELNRLRDIYEICLKSVGEGHREASKQPNITSKAVEK